MNAPVTFGIPQRGKLRAQDFHVLAAAGAFRANWKTELIEGEIWVVNAIHRWHARTMMHLGNQLLAALSAARSDLDVFSPVSVDLTDESVPEPDVSVGVYDRTNDLGPLAGTDLRIAIEIADTSLDFDLNRKTRLYGAAGTPEYWIVVRETSSIVQQWSPTSDGYAERRDVKIGERLVSATLPWLSIDTAPLL